MTSALLLSCLLATSAGAQVGPQIDDVVRAEMQARHIPGVSVAVVREGRLVHAKGYGFANLELRSPATAESVYQIGSINKPFTAMLAMMLVEEGKLELEAPISRYLPDAPAAWKEVRLRHLLDHTSGIKSYTEMDETWRRQREDVTPEAIARMSYNLPLDFAPGEGWAYNNTGYVMLGSILERVGGKPYEELLADRILRPLDMASTQMNVWDRIIPNRAAGYSRRRGETVNADYLSMTWPYSAGAMSSSVLDLAKWAAALEAQALLKPDSYRRMWSPTKLANGQTRDYGLGWAVGRLGSREFIGHDGGIPGFTSSFIWLPKERLAVIALANADVGVSRITRGIAGVFYADLKPPERSAPIADPAPETTAMLRRFVEEALQGRVDRTKLTPEFDRALTPALVEQVAKTLGAAGKLERFELIKREDLSDGGLRLEYAATVGSERLTAIATLTPDGKIAGLQFRPM
jgi:D-alanyl-D-alanine carboxypeptidase